MFFLERFFGLGKEFHEIFLMIVTIGQIKTAETLETSFAE